MDRLEGVAGEKGAQGSRRVFKSHQFHKLIIHGRL